jgi:two-component sensor histidine kinase
MALKPQQTPHLAPGRRVRIDSDAETMVALEADNALLRAALAHSESAEMRLTLVTQELKHRIGNVLAVVQAIARHTFREADPDSVDDFGARILALGEAQRVLIESETRRTTMANVVRSALSPHCAEGDRARSAGPELALDGRRAYALTLALHELATNAAKYGALSSEDGWIEVVWTTTGSALDFVWREHDGPQVATPTRRGFGSRLITRNLAIAFGGEVDLDFKPAGVECRLRAPALVAA